LKPGGKVFISDYSCSDGEHTDLFKAYVKQRGYALLSPTKYGEVSTGYVVETVRTCFMHNDIEPNNIPKCPGQ